MGLPTVVAVRVLVPDADAGADYHRQPTGHWISDSKIANPMSLWPEYRATRASWGIGAMGTFVVEVETSDGHVGFAPSIGGPPAAFIVERHLSRFVEGKPLSVEGIAEAWEQMFRGSLYYGRRGLAVNAISAVDLALWDALGRSRGEPVWSLLGGKRLDGPLRFYATGPRPDIAKGLGFVGAKMPLPAGPGEGHDGLAEDVAMAASMRAACDAVDGDRDFFLSWDCYMSLDVPFALALASAMEPYRFKWIEECLPPDDYWGYAALRQELRSSGSGLLSTTGEHESTRWGFKLLLEWGCADILQPDVGWCGGLTELVRIAELAASFGVPVVPHGSSVYSYHFLVTRPDTPFAEFLMMHPQAGEIVPMFAPLLVGEPVPVGGRLEVGDAAGFGVELNRSLPLVRPYPR